MAFGILAAGAYIPRLRLQRKSIVEANRWFAPGLASLGKGERAMCNWDEDAITMAVEAARDTTGQDRAALQTLYFASTTFPFLDRLNAGVVAEALCLPQEVNAIDVASSQRCATSALGIALRAAVSSIVVASEHRRTRAASPIELTSGDGAAAVVVGEGSPIARLLASAQSTFDFVDHFRTADSVYDYQWEERWVRDAGYMTIVPPVIARCLAAASINPSEVTYFCMPATVPRVVNAVANAAGIRDAAIVDNLHPICGDTGAAHPLLLLVSVLERAKVGDRILVVGFGQGADALLFESTGARNDASGRLGSAGYLARRREETSYAKFLAFNDLIEIERGMRSEIDKLTPLSALWRNRDTVTGMIGGKCEVCGTIQFPITRICANPNCNAVDAQEPHPFAEKTGRVNSFTADRLTYSPDPPACYGMVQFEEGGRWMMDFTDVDADKLAVGMSMRMMFRIKDVDTQRGFRRYFWKAAPIEDGRS